MVPDTRVGTTVGPEFIGVVETVGSSVQNLKPGDRVMVPFNVFCGSCFFCARGLYFNCHDVDPNATAVGGIYGYSHTCGGYNGGQAEFVRVPFADVGPTIIPDWMDDEDAVLLTDALATGYFGAQLGDIVVSGWAVHGGTDHHRQGSRHRSPARIRRLGGQRAALRQGGRPALGRAVR